MRADRPRRGACLGLAFTVLLSLVAGCGALGERVVGWSVTRQVDDYLDLDADQKRAARTRVDEALGVLRQSELPAWLALLRELRQGVHDGLGEPLLVRLEGRYQARLDAGVALLVPRVAPLLADLSPAQLTHLERRLRKDVDETYDEHGLSPDARRAANEKRALAAVERFTGTLRDDQRARVRSIVSALPDDRPAQRRASLARIARFRAFMATRPSTSQLEAELHAMWQRRDEGLRDVATRRAEQRKALLEIDRLLDAKQRAQAEDALTDRIKTLKRFLAS